MAEENIEFLELETDNQTESCDFILRLQKTLKVLIAAGYAPPEKVEQAFLIAGWK